MTTTGQVERTTRTARNPSTIRFRDLGPLLVEIDGHTRPVGGARLEAALALLLIHAGHRVGLDALVEAMWGADGVARSASTLDSHVFRLRHALEPHRRAGQPSSKLLRDTGGYRLVATPDQLDSQRFARLAADATGLLAAGSPEQGLRRAEEALALWRGRPYGDAADAPWATAAAARLEELHDQVGETHIGALLATGAAERALVELETALAVNPLRERLWALRIVAFRDSGRRADALHAYGRARDVLVGELGIEPGPQLRALHAELLDDDSAAAPVPAVPAPRPAPSRRPPPEPEPVHLPAPRHRLLGRDRVLAELTGLLATHPLVTLAGPAGCGKTRLAVEAARQVAADRAGGVWFVDLTAATADRVLDTVSSAVGLPVPTGSSLEALRAFTRGRRMLLVLDNCEHVLDAVAELVEQLLVDGSELGVLATSREPLDVAGEQVHPLGPLPTGGNGSPAVALFLERLEEQTPGLSRDGDARARAAEIAAAVDGLPLALELAAGRARAYSLPEIAGQVRADASSLSRIGRGRASHHGTVRGAIDTSYRVLPGPEAALHRAAGAVPGPFTAALASALGDATPTDADTVAGLVHRSLLTPLGPARPGGPSRFAQLATVRGHALHAARSLSEDVDLARDAWVERLVRARPAFGSRRQSGWYRALDDDLAALRATLQHTLVDDPSALGVALCARLGAYWTFTGMAIEGTAWIRAAAAACAHDPGLGTRTDRALVRISLGGLMTVQGRPDEGRAELTAAIEEARGATGADAALLCTDLTVATGPAFITGDTGLLERIATAVREIACGAPELDVTVRHAEIAGPLVDAGAHPGLLERLVDLHADARADDNHYTAWAAAVGAVQVLLAGGRPAEARTWATAAVQDGVELGERENPITTETLACTLALTGDHAGAVRAFGLTEAHHVRLGMPWPASRDVSGLVDAAAGALGRDAAARARSEGMRMTLADLVELGRA